MRITDSALVAAANLSNRYIADRFLPDKAIDLVDEAASRLAIEKESVPEPIDRIQRRLRQLELAHRQLVAEEEESAVAKRAEVEEEMESLGRELASLREQWDAEKMGLDDVQSIRRKRSSCSTGSRSSMPRQRRSSCVARVQSRSIRKCLTCGHGRESWKSDSTSSRHVSRKRNRIKPIVREEDKTSTVATRRHRGGNRRGGQRLDRRSGDPNDGNRTGKIVGDGRPFAQPRDWAGRSR